jgi:hypothetical protein
MMSGVLCMLKLISNHSLHGFSHKTIQAQLNVRPPNTRLSGKLCSVFSEAMGYVRLRVLANGIPSFSS